MSQSDVIDLNVYCTHIKFFSVVYFLKKVHMCFTW